MKFSVTKSYGHDLGLSCAFRQWRAQSHCRFVHGYALAFDLVFGCDELDRQGWVLDFGGLKDVKKLLVGTFDHSLFVAIDDPSLNLFKQLSEDRAAQVVMVPTVGTEAFAMMVYNFVNHWLVKEDHHPRVKLISVTCREHAGNAATVHG